MKMFDSVNRTSNNRFKNLFQEASFNLGFGVGIATFIVLNYISYLISWQEYMTTGRNWSAGGYFTGFPFKAHHTFIGHPSGDEIFLLGFTADLLIALLSSLALGLIARSIWTRVFTRSLART